MNDSITPNRREFLATLALLATPGVCLADDDDREVDAVKEIAAKAGFKDFRVSKNDEYLAIGDAPDSFRARAVELCSALEKDYLKHFAAKGFPANKPASRLTMVVLASPVAFKAFLNEGEGGSLWGVFDIETNRLVIYDNRKNTEVAQSERANSVALMHEATHQLTYNTGLFDRLSDVPLLFSEGLAMYGETRRPNNKGKVGDVNTEWMPILAPKGGPKPEFFPVAELLEKDTLLNDDDVKIAQLARAQSWLLVHYLMKNAQRSAKFKAYLALIKGRKDAKNRLQDWKATFGVPEAMDRELLGYLKKL